METATQGSGYVNSWTLTSLLTSLLKPQTHTLKHSSACSILKPLNPRAQGHPGKMNLRHRQVTSYFVLQLLLYKKENQIKWNSSMEWFTYIYIYLARNRITLGAAISACEKGSQWEPALALLLSRIVAIMVVVVGVLVFLLVVVVVAVVAQGDGSKGWWYW